MTPQVDESACLRAVCATLRRERDEARAKVEDLRLIIRTLVKRVQGKEAA